MRPQWPFGLSDSSLLIGVLLATSPALAADEPSVPSLSAAQLEQLNAGEVLINVVPGEVPVGDAMGVVNATPAQVRDVLSDFDNYDQFMQSMASSEVIRVEGEYTFCRGVTDTPWPMADREWVLRASGGEQVVDGMNVIVVRWDYVPGSGNIENVDGYWLMIPWGDGGSQTLLRYHVAVDLGTWLPDFVLEWATENMLPEEIEAVRHRLGV